MAHKGIPGRELTLGDLHHVLCNSNHIDLGGGVKVVHVESFYRVTDHSKMLHFKLECPDGSYKNISVNMRSIAEKDRLVDVVVKALKE